MFVDLYVFIYFESLYNLAFHTRIYTFILLYVIFRGQSKLTYTDFWCSNVSLPEYYSYDLN
jgi:hypothetical protein